MFSGIVSQVKSAKLQMKSDGGIRCRISIPKDWSIKEGESIAIDGICSTVEKVVKRVFTVFWMPETTRCTSLAFLSNTHQFNLEQPLTLQTFIDGHLVSGHVDTTAHVLSIKKSGDDVMITFSLDKQWTKYIIHKGSIAVNGVALTVVERSENSFSVSLIPYTLSHTNLGALQKDDIVNIEVDTVAKYIEQLLPRKFS